MAQVIVKKNMGAKYLVSLTGHDQNLGQIECIVSLPPKAKLSTATAARRNAVVARTTLLAEAFVSALQEALVSRLNREDENGNGDTYSPTA